MQPREGRRALPRERRRAQPRERRRAQPRTSQHQERRMSPAQRGSPAPPAPRARRTVRTGPGAAWEVPAAVRPPLRRVRPPATAARWRGPRAATDRRPFGESSPRSGGAAGSHPRRWPAPRRCPAAPESRCAHAATAAAGSGVWRADRCRDPGRRRTGRRAADDHWPRPRRSPRTRSRRCRCRAHRFDPRTETTRIVTMTGPRTRVRQRRSRRRLPRSW